MNYYIKVLRSNIDNILSSESVSPAAYYSRREFGYRRFDMASDDKSEYELYLWDRILDTDEDVVYIEMSGSDPQLQNLIKAQNRDVYIVRKTIRLYPWNCKILFKNTSDAKDTIFICKSSLMNKMWNCYSFGIAPKGELEHHSYYVADSLEINISADVNRDFRWNRVKGFLFAYSIGVAKSLTPSLARLLQAELNIYGLATVLSGMNTASKDIQDSIERQKKIFNTNDPNRLLLKKRWEELVLNQFSTLKDGQIFEEILKKLGVQRLAMDEFAKEQGIALGPKLDTSVVSSSYWKSFKAGLHDYTESVLSQYQKYVRNESDNPIEVVDLHIKIHGKGRNLYELILNHSISHADFLSVERIRSKKLEVANDLSMFIKDYYSYSGQKWDGTDEQNYMNELRKNIAYSTPFDIHKTGNKELQALAAYILKGDVIDDMIKFIQISAIEDYSLILGLWGVNVGYTDIPKTFFNLMNLKSEELTKCYLNSCELLTGDYTEHSLDPDGYRDVLTLHVSDDSVQYSAGPKKTIKEALRLSPIHLSDSQIEEIMNIIHSSSNSFDNGFYKRIGKIKGIGKKKLSEIQQILTPFAQVGAFFFSEDAQSHATTGTTGQDLWKIIEECLPNDDKVRSQVKKDFEWFLRKNQLPREEMIIKFSYYLSRNKNPAKNRTWLKDIYKHVDVQLIEDKLKKEFLK